MYPYHNRLRQLLKTHEYVVFPGEPPFVYRFFFPTLGRSIPIREHRLPEYQKFLKGGTSRVKAN